MSVAEGTMQNKINKTDQLAKSVVIAFQENRMNESNLSFLIKQHFIDMMKVVRNINETSLSEKDRFERITKVAFDFGLSKVDLI